MRRIHKHEITEMTDGFETDLPVGARILTVQVQKSGFPCFWYAFDDDLKHTTKRRFRMVGTGHDIPDYDDLDYIGTFTIFNGDIVVHLFEIDEMTTADELILDAKIEANPS